MASTRNEKEVKTNWPVTSGLTARTTRQVGRVSNLVPVNSYVGWRDKVGL